MNLLSIQILRFRTLYFLFCQELVIALQRTGDPGGLSCLRPHLDALAGLDPTAETETPPDWPLLLQALKVFYTDLFIFPF